MTRNYFCACSLMKLAHIYRLMKIADSLRGGEYRSVIVIPLSDAALDGRLLSYVVLVAGVVEKWVDGGGYYVAEWWW